MRPTPHGGTLVERLATSRERERREAELPDLPKIRPFIDEVYDAEKIGIGAYSPLTGFMDRTTLDSVVSTGRLPNDLPWTIPITLAPRGRADTATLAKLSAGDAVALLDDKNRFFALLT